MVRLASVARRVMWLALVGVGAALMGPLAPASSAPTVQVPACVVGNWRAVDFASSMRQLMAEMGTVETVGGDLRLAVQPSGAYEVRFAQVSVTIQTEVGPGTLGMDAVGTGNLREVAPGMLAASGARFTGSMTMTLGDQTSTQDEDHVTDEGLPAPFECSGGRLVMGMETSGDARGQFTFERQ